MEKSKTYGYVKAVISNPNKKYDKDEMLNNLDLFKLGNRITADEYSELVKIINDNKNN